VTEAGQATLELVDAERTLQTTWFSSVGCVYREGDRCQVFVGGSLIGEFGPDDVGLRNVLVVGLAADPRAHLGDLANAFQIGSETLRQLRKVYAAQGPEALLARRHGGAHNVKITEARRRKLEALFAQGVTIDGAMARVGSRWSVSRSAIGNVHAAWVQRAERSTPPSATPSEPSTTAIPQLPFEAPSSPATPSSSDDASVATTDAADATEPALGAMEESDDAGDPLPLAEPVSAAHVQHAGSWLLLAIVAAEGLHAEAAALRGERVRADALRLALDALIVALGIGEHTVEGARRLATPTAPVLLRATRAPSATWVRRALGRFARDAASTWLHLKMAGRWIREAAQGEESAAVFYVDNHLRHYTGQEALRMGWRMQDKRAVPGASDFYVHDEDGRPVLRLHAPDNPSLTEVLTPAAKLLRAALGKEQRIVLAFDRGGSFPAQMEALRDEGFEFVTYERRPYALLSPSAFEGRVTLDDETYAVHDTRKNLGGGRGRVRRIAVRTPDDRQVNLLAVSSLPAARLLEIMRGRWSQENAFKHGAERWGINELDGRATAPYDPATIVPNPARRRLDRALRLARAQEGDARRVLADPSAKGPRRERAETDLAEAVAQQTELVAQRPLMPSRVALSESELADTLVKHEPAYKLLIDTVRIACANAESELAALVGAHLRKPAEAKRVLRNVFVAPGDVVVSPGSVTVKLAPAGTRTELDAIAAMLDDVNARRLSLPGDRVGRRVRFQLQT
jgi:hypothetical protein